MAIRPDDEQERNRLRSYALTTTDVGQTTAFRPTSGTSGSGPQIAPPTPFRTTPTSAQPTQPQAGGSQTTTTQTTAQPAQPQQPAQTAPPTQGSTASPTTTASVNPAQFQSLYAQPMAAQALPQLAATGAVAQPDQGGPPNWYDRLWQLVTEQPNFGTVSPTISNQLAALRTDLMGRAQQMPETLQYGRIAAENPALVAALEMGGGGNVGMAQFAQDLLNQPTRYDTELFQQLLDIGLSRLDEAAERDRLNILRDSAMRLGPYSGQLTNEYIDLAAEYGRQRNELLANLAREAALTQMQDRLAALQGARGVASDIFGRAQSMREEERGERAFQRDTDLLNQAARERATDRLAQIASQIFGEEAALRGEAREERDFQVADRLRRLQELQQFGAIDRQLGLDARDTEFQRLQLEHQMNMDRLRAMQQEFMNALALAQLFANLPADVTGGTTPYSRPPTDVGSPSIPSTRGRGGYVLLPPPDWWEQLVGGDIQMI